jgi:hypothetical protein
MAFAFVQEAHSFSFATGQPTITLGSNVTKGNLLVCWVRSTSPTYQAMNDRAFQWIQILNKQHASGSEYLSAWYCIAKFTEAFSVQFFDANAVIGGQDVAVNLTSATGQVLEFSGNSLNPFDAVTFATGTSTTASATVATSAANDLVIAIQAAASTTHGTAGSGYTDPTALATYSAEYATQSAIGSYSPTFTLASSVAWGCMAISFKPVDPALTTIQGSLGAAGAGASIFIQSKTTTFWKVITADGFGNYSTTVPPDKYIVNPSLVGQTFATPNQTVDTTGTTLTQTQSDNFTRANENPLSGGGNWAAFGTGLGATAGKIVSNLVETTANGTIAAAIFSGPGSWPSNDQYSTVTMQALTGVTNNTIRACVRVQSGSAFTNYSLENDVAVGFRIVKWVAGVATVLVTQSAIAVTPGDTMTLAVVGTKLYGYYNGVLKFTAADSALSSGYPGFSLYAGTVGGAEISAWVGGTATVATVTQNFTASACSTNLNFTTTVSDTFTRANESPLNPTNWSVNNTPVPPWDYPLAIVSNKAVMANPTIVANYAGPWFGDGVSVYKTAVADNCFIEVEVDALTRSSLGYFSSGIELCLRSSPDNTTAAGFVILNLGDGTCLLQGGLQAVSSNPPTLQVIAPFSLGDKFRFACVGTTFYILRNGAIVGNYIDSTTYASPSHLVPIIVGVNQLDVQLSNFLGGTAAQSMSNITLGNFITGAVAITPANAFGNGLSFGSPTTIGQFRAPYPVVFCDVNGNELSVTGLTTSSQVAGAVPVVLCDPTGHAFTGSVLMSSNGVTMTINSTLTGNKCGTPVPIVLCNSSGKSIVSTTLGAYVATPLPVCMTTPAGAEISLS